MILKINTDLKTVSMEGECDLEELKEMLDSLGKGWKLVQEIKMVPSLNPITPNIPYT